MIFGTFFFFEWTELGMLLRSSICLMRCCHQNLEGPLLKVVLALRLWLLLRYALWAPFFEEPIILAAKTDYNYLANILVNSENLFSDNTEDYWWTSKGINPNIEHDFLTVWSQITDNFSWIFWQIFIIIVKWSVLFRFLEKVTEYSLGWNNIFHDLTIWHVSSKMNIEYF